MLRKKTVSRIFAITGCVLLVLGIAAYGIWSYVFSGLVYRPLGENGALDNASPFPTDPSASLEPTRVAPHVDDILNILLIGTDSRNSATTRGRSDVLIVLTVDRQHGTLKLMSIMRDLYVPIPGHGNDKINAAYAYGGADLAIRTVNENFGLDIKEYAEVDFLGAEKVIDAAGGVLIDVKQSEIDDINVSVNEENRIFTKLPPVAFVQNPGLQLLVGRQAVAYARVRHVDSDFQRTQRQRDVLTALLKSFSQASLVNKTQIVQKGLAAVTTNMTPSEITWLSLEVLPLLGNGVKELRIPTDGDYKVYPNGAWYMVPDRNAIIPKIQEFIWEQTFPFDPYPTIAPPKDAAPSPTVEATATGEPTPTLAEDSPTPEATTTPEPTASPTPEPTATPTA